MNYATANETKTTSDDSVLTSVYIPRVYGNIPQRFIQETFEALDLGVVSNIQCVKREGNAYMAFVHFKSWNTTNPAAVNLAKKVNDPNAQARVVYDDPWYWILLPNKSSAATTTTTTATTTTTLPHFSEMICAQEWEQMEKSRIKREKEECERALKEEEEQDMKEIDAYIAATTLNHDEEMDLLTLLVEDLQSRLFACEKNNAILQQEVCNLRTILLTGESSTDTPSKPKLVRQRAISEQFETDCSPPIGHPKLVRQNATVVESDMTPPPTNDDEDLPVPQVSPIGGGPSPLMRELESSDYERESSSYCELPDVYPNTAPILPPMPFVVEPTHFHSSETVPVILYAIEKALYQYVTIREFNEDKCKFSCRYLGMDFVVRVFSTQQGNNLIEFQRRYGDRSTFRHVYDLVSSELKFDNIIDVFAPKSSQSNHQYKPAASKSTTTESESIPFDSYMRSTIMKNMVNGEDFPTRPSHVEADWWPSNEDVKNYQEDRRTRRMEEAQLETVKVDGMGLVYPKMEAGFWCDP